MIRVLIADSTRFLCDSLSAALKEKANIFIVGCATTSEELWFLLRHAHVVLLGKTLEDKCTMKLLEGIRLNHPQIKVIITGVNDDPKTILHYVEAGAVGYILRQESVEEIVQKLQALQEEKALISPTIAAQMMERLAQLSTLRSLALLTETRINQLDTLSPRELEILHLISVGYTNQEIAAQLYIECGTVKNHVHNILKKLEASNRQDAAKVYQMQYQSPVGV
ncbi:MAG: response regulator transcription factor [Chloroflexi bacterium]|nr:response regulator transcription factor [Chloroflexota bacterium]MBP8058505.1 response regulator transcription factor [Chloroflexota bacterium]